MVSLAHATLIGLWREAADWTVPGHALRAQSDPNAAIVKQSTRP
jgi:hypothetical protein